MELGNLKDVASNFTPAIHGAIGGAIRFITGDEKSFWRGVVTMVVGAVCAQYLTPLIDELIHTYTGFESAGYGLSFVIGYLGLIILRKIESMVKGSSLKGLFKEKKS